MDKKYNSILVSGSTFLWFYLVLKTNFKEISLTLLTTINLSSYISNSILHSQIMTILQKSSFQSVKVVCYIQEILINNFFIFIL